VLKETRWNRVRAAKLLGISYRALLYKIKDVGLASDRTSEQQPVPAGS
jgi:two-component system response regulator AtoC